jgi:hypothetical protein
MTTMSQLPDELRARVLQAARQQPSATRGVHRQRVAILLLSGAAALGAVFWLAGGVRLGARSTELVLGTVLGALLAAALAAVVAVGRGGSMLGRPRAWLAGTALLVPVALFGWKLLWSARFPEALVAHPEAPGFRCLGLTIAMSLWPLAALALSRRDSDPTHPIATGVSLGVAVGAGAWVLVDLWCPVAYPLHLLLGHVLPLALLAGLGALLGRGLIALRA